MTNYLSTSHLAIGYKGKALMEDINVGLPAGKVTAMIGRNGAGKSTLIHTITGSLKPVGGEILIKGEPLRKYTRHDLSKTMALVNTDPHSAGGLRLHEIVGLGRIPYTGRLGILSSRDKRIVDEAMEKVGISHKRDSFISELSDGERQKGMIARGLVQETPVIIMDEPFSYLDVASRLEILYLLKRIAEEENKAVLFSTHEIVEALKAVDHTWIFNSGRIDSGSPAEMVERGCLDNLFPETNVKFNHKSWEFEYDKK